MKQQPTESTLNDVVIRVENLSKRYALGKRQASSGDGLRHALQEAVSSPWRKLRSAFSSSTSSFESSRSASEEFYALRDVSFEVKRGEVLGIIGRNGAGKSTLLKILSRITEPTSGRIGLKGRVASLLEVGTGFHPELTGRENIYLNGAILGMSRAEVRGKFSEIVEFAEVEKFLDTPVKHYSSGMYVRLAFAVAAHLEPEILIVDEVLAVGDAEFQKKCLGKMSEAASGGRTVLFVSHSMTTINRLCRRCLLLAGGRIEGDSDVFSITARYQATEQSTMALQSWEEEPSQPGDDVAKLRKVCVMQDGCVTDTVDIRKPIDVKMTYENLREGRQLLSSFAFMNAEGILLFVSADFLETEVNSARPRGVYESICSIPGNLFSEGMVRVVTEVSTRHPVYEIHFLVYDSVAFQVVDHGEDGSVRAGWGRTIPGAVRPFCQWTTELHEVVEESPNGFLVLEKA